MSFRDHGNTPTTHMPALADTLLWGAWRILWEGSGAAWWGEAATGRKWVILEEAMGIVKPTVAVFQTTGWARLALPGWCLCGGWGP